MSFPERQYDIPRDTSGNYLIIPQDDILRQNGRDFVRFVYDKSTMKPGEYRVVVESASNASPDPRDRFRDIGPLGNTIELPHTYFSQGFGSHAKILVLPASSHMDAYVGNLVRGSTYIVDKYGPVVSPQGHRAMTRTGVQ